MSYKKLWIFPICGLLLVSGLGPVAAISGKFISRGFWSCTKHCAAPQLVCGPNNKTVELRDKCQKNCGHKDFVVGALAKSYPQGTLNAMTEAEKMIAYHERLCGSFHTPSSGHDNVSPSSRRQQDDFQRELGAVTDIYDNYRYPKGREDQSTVGYGTREDSSGFRQGPYGSQGHPQPSSDQGGYPRAPLPQGIYPSTAPRYQ